MNALTRFKGMSAAAFAELVLSPDDMAITVEGDMIRFDLVMPRSDVMIQGEIQGQIVKKSGWINAENPEFDKEVKLDVVQIEHDYCIGPIALVVDFYDIAAVTGQPFMLTNEQVSAINDRIFEEVQIKAGV